VLEWADKWTSYEPELESLFNELSRGQATWVISRRLGRQLNPFDKELQNALRGINKRIVLERSPVECVYIREGDVVELAKAKRLNEAVSLYVNELKILAQNLVKRDDALVQMLERMSKTSRRIFVSRGADHELYLRSLLDQESIAAECIAYEKPPLLRRLITSLTIDKQISEIDVERVIWAMRSRQRNDYLEFVALQEKAQSMTEKELLERLSK
jgi:hypothetical protein